MEVFKQGIEIELNVINKEKYFKRIGIIHDRFLTLCKEKISSRFYFDDNKPEFPSIPYITLPELEAHLSSIFKETFSLAEKKNYYLSLLGSFPYYYDYCSGHIHTSIKKWDEDSWIQMRDKLYNAQPLIALLSANSPIRTKEYLGSDVRLMLSNWSSPVPYGDKTSHHWMALAKGRHTPTLECRIPSSGPLFQLLGIANIIRVLLNDEDTDIPVISTVETFRRVAKYGTEALVDVRLPKKITYHGVKYNVVKVKIIDLFKMYLKDNLSVIKEGIKDCKLYKEIMAFYESIASGVSVSDKILGLWQNKGGEEFVEILHKFNETSYKLRPSLEKLPLPKNKIILPELSVSLEEFKEIIQHVSSSIDFPIFPEGDIVDLINTREKLHLIRDIIRECKKYGDTSISSPEHMLELYLKHKVLKPNKVRPGSLVPGPNFPYLVQILEGSDLL